MSTPGEKAVADTDRASDRQSRVFLLGRFEVWLGDSIVIDRSWSRRKARTLLKLLAVQPARTMHRDQVQGWLWPDLDATAAANNLHKNLHFLRAALAQHGVAGVVSLTSDLVVLASDVWIDAEGFRALAHQARAAANDIGLFRAGAGAVRGRPAARRHLRRLGRLATRGASVVAPAALARPGTPPRGARYAGTRH